MRIVWSRAIASVFWFATAGYCVLSAVPFASEQFLKPGLVPALVTFAGWHTWISLAALVACAAALAPWRRSGHGALRALIAVWAMVVLASFFAPPLSQLEPSATALALALLSLVPPMWIALMRLPGSSSEHHPNVDNAHTVGADFAACVVAAIVVTVMHALSAVPSVFALGLASVALGALRSLLLHLIVFSGIFAAISVLRGLSRLISARAAVEAWLARAVIAITLLFFLSRVVLRPLALTGSRGAIVAAVVGVALAAVFGPRATQAPPGLEQALSGLVPRWSTRSVPAAMAWLAMAAIAVWLMERQAAQSDWNFVIAKSVALASWLIALSAALRMPTIRAPRSGVVPFAACFVLLGMNAAVSRVEGVPAQAADLWRAHDASNRLITDALSPPAAVSDIGLVDFLQLHTNIPRSTHVAPVTIDLATLAGAPAAVRPHIFIFVVDSLRRDYVSPYNRQVTFTPALERFARESTVFERAFTRYGATGLSVPSLWVGGLVLHKQYVTPYAPMNTLAKLLEHEQYAQWIGMDNILDVILPPSARREPLDADVQVADFRLCRTLGEIRGRLDRLKASGQPTFVYSLPQDVHVSAITREGAAPIDSASYGTFYRALRVTRPTARCVLRRVHRRSEVTRSVRTEPRRRDGRPRRLARRTGSDGTRVHHLPGDSSGAAHRASTVRVDRAAVGSHRPQRLPPISRPPSTRCSAMIRDRRRAFFGHPLFRKGDAPSTTRSADPQLVASSYGSVYGTLLDDARRLYIFDGIAMREYTLRTRRHRYGPNHPHLRPGPRARSARYSRNHRGHCAIQSLSPIDNRAK